MKINPTLKKTSQVVAQCVLGLAGLVLAGRMILPGFVSGQPVRTANLPAGFQMMDIAVDSVKGNVFYRRPPSQEFMQVTAATHLRQSDVLAVDFGAVVKLLFEYHPGKEQPTKTSAMILKGYTEMAIHTALAKAGKTYTWLDMRQGNLRAGVVKTAKPPSYRVRTPQVVVAIRGTEIGEMDASMDLGPRFALGRAGLAELMGKFGERRLMAPGQQTRAGSPLMLAVQAARLNSYATLTGPNQSGNEQGFANRTWDNKGKNLGSSKGKFGAFTGLKGTLPNTKPHGGYSTGM